VDLIPPHGCVPRISSCCRHTAGLRVTKLVIVSSPSVRGQRGASVEALCGVLGCAGGVCPAVAIHVAFQTAYQAKPATLHMIFMSLCVAAPCEVFGGTAVVCIEVMETSALDQLVRCTDCILIIFLDKRIR